MEKTDTSNTIAALITSLSGLAVLLLLAMTFFMYEQIVSMRDENKQLLVELKNDVSILQASSIDGQTIQTAVSSVITTLQKQKDDARIQQLYSGYEAALEQPKGDGYVYGNPDAKISLIEFSDFECPYCRKYHDTPKSVVDASKELVNWKFKHLPLQSHNPAAMSEAIATECVGKLGNNRAFWVFADSIFKNTRSNGKGVAQGLTSLAENIGIDASAFTECMSDNEIIESVYENLKTAQSMGISSTPVTVAYNNTTGKSVIMKGMKTRSDIYQQIKKIW